MKDRRSSSIDKDAKSRGVSAAMVFFLAAVVLLLTIAAQMGSPSMPTVLASSPDFDAEVRDIRLSPSSVSEGDTADIFVGFKNLSRLDGPYVGAATFDHLITVHSPSGEPATYHKDDLEFSFDETLELVVSDFEFDETGRWEVEAAVYDIRGRESDWDDEHMFDTRAWYFYVDQGDPDFDAEIERIWLSRSVKSGETADIKVRVGNLAWRHGPYDGDGTYDVLLVVTTPSREKFTKEWDNRELGYREDVTLEWEDFQFEEVGRYHFSAEVHDIRGLQADWNSAHMFDDRSWDFSVEQGDPEWDAEVSGIWLSSEVEEGGEADIRVRFENQSSVTGSDNGWVTMDMNLKWISPSGSTSEEVWDDFEFSPNQNVTLAVENVEFLEAGRWEFWAGIYDIRGFQEGFPEAHMFDDGNWSYTVVEAELNWDAKVNDIRVSESTNDIEVTFENLSDEGGRFDISIIVTPESGQPVRYAYDDQVFENGQSRTFRPPYNFSQSGPYTILAEIFDLDGMQEEWSGSHRFDSESQSFRVTIPEDLVDLCPAVTLQGGRSPWLLKLKVDGQERDLDSRGCVKLAGDSDSGIFGEGEYLVEVVHPGYLSATLLVYLVEGDPPVVPEVHLLAGDINGDGYVGPGDIDLNRDGLITEDDATLLWGSGLADIDGDGEVLLSTDVLALAQNLGRTQSPTFVACQVLFADETPDNPDDPIDWTAGGCTQGDVEEIQSWLKTLSDGADTVNLIACGVFLGNIILAVIPPTSPSAVALPYTGAACFATGVAATGLAAAEFSSRNDGENITKIIQGDWDAIKEGGFIIGVGAFDFVGGGAFLKLGRGALRVTGKLGLKSTKNGAKASKVFSLEPIEATILSKGVDRRLASALGSEDEAAKLVKNVQGLKAPEQANFYGTVARATHLDTDQKLKGLDEYLRGIKDQSGDALVRSLRELQVAVGLAQSRRAAGELVVIGSHELPMNLKSRGSAAKVFAQDKQLDVLELSGDSAAAVRGATGTGLKATLKDGIFIEDVLKVHEITRVEFDVGVQSISDSVIWQKLNRPLTDGSLKSKFADLRGARTASNIPRLNRVVFLDFVDGAKQKGIGRDAVNLIASNADVHMKRAEYVGADNVVIHFLGDATVRINNVYFPNFVPHILTVTAEGTAVSLRQVWNAGVISLEQMGGYEPADYPIELIHGEGPWTPQQSSNGTGGGGSGGGGGSSGGGGSGSGGGGSSGGGSTPSSSDPPAPNQCRHEIAPGTSVNGEWTDSCESSVPGRGYSRFYGFTLDVAGEVVIDVQSSEDPYVFLREGDATTGPALHFNDDVESGDTNSRIMATLESGNYLLEVTTYGRGVTGDFALSATIGDEGKESAATGCSPVALTLPAVSVAGSWANDCESSVPGRGYARYYCFTLREGAEVTIDLTSSVDTYLYLRACGDSTSGTIFHENDDVTANDRNSRIVATLAAGSWSIEATTYSEDTTGAFSLSVTAAGGGADGLAASGCSPIELTLPAVNVAGSWADDCESDEPSRGYARYYCFTLSEGAEVTIDLTSSVDTFLYLRECDSTSGTILHENDDIASNDRNSRIVATLAAGIWSAEATTYSKGVLGDFALSIIAAGQDSTAIGCNAVALTLPGVAIAGNWDDDCQSSEPGRGYSRFYQFNLDVAGEVTINVLSSEDPYVFLRADGATAGESLYYNDDVESGNTNSQIVAMLAAGTYTVEVSTYAEGVTGDFTLSIGG